MAFVPPPPLISADRPLLLFPVRLETRFYPAQIGVELRVRIYPDKVHVDTHEPELTEEEVTWGNNFLELLRVAGQDETKRKAAWKQLADRFGAPRATWIITQPVPLTAKPGKEAWTRAPQTSVLPDGWIALAYLNGNIIARGGGKPIRDILPVGPNPQADASAGDLPVDADMKWIVDFAAAEDAGMALRLQLPPEAANGIDRLIVFGVKKSLDSKASSVRLQNLFQAHQYTDGLSVLLQGTPTNNTLEVSSGFSSTDPGHEKSYQVVLNEKPLPEGSNGVELAKAVGLKPDIFKRTAQAETREQQDARQMNTALWATTWGYFLEQMMAGLWADDVADKNIASARTHFIEHVRASGPLPALRIGKQPYGILPVTSLELWKPTATDNTPGGLLELLKKLQGLWRTLTTEENVPRMGRSTTPSQDLPEVLRTDGLSGNYSVRNVFGRHYVHNIWAFLNQFPTFDWWKAQSNLAMQALQALLPLTNLPPRLTGALFLDQADQLKAETLPLVQAATTSTLTPNYPEQLLQATKLQTIRNEEFTPKSNSLLYLLLRHSMLLEYAAAAHRQLGTAFFVRREPELVSMFSPTATVWDRITQAGLLEGEKFTNPADLQVRDFRAALQHLRQLAPETLSNLLRSTLDLCSHRLDAWITSLATKRLKSMRQINATGIYLGGYGWVENLKPAPKGAALPPPPGETAPVIAAPGNPGFMQAPSLDQAATVALLRSGHLSHANDGQQNVFAIDLSSGRVRLVEWLLNGVRQGQPLGALLGYRFERGLHENHPDVQLDKFIKPFRDQVPFKATRVNSAGAMEEAIAANHVVDGLSLYRRMVEDENTILSEVCKALGITFVIFGSMFVFKASREYAAIKAEIAALGNAIDALGDALLAESVYHVVRGNPVRTAATLEALERGEAPPPELEVIKTPRTGNANTYREIVLFTGNPLSADGWTISREFGFRAVAEPHLNGWAGRLLGRPDKVRIMVERLDATSHQVLETREIRLSNLQLCPLDIIYAAQTDGTGQSELEQRIFYFMKRLANGIATDAVLRVNPARNPAWLSSELSYGEFVELARTARRLLTGTRELRQDDFTHVEVSDVITIDLNELQLRAQRAHESLRSVRGNLRAIIAAPALDKIEALRKALLQMTHFGLSTAFPLSALGTMDADLELLLAQARSVDKEVLDRLARLETIRVALNDVNLTVAKRLGLCLARLHEVFGKSFLILPRFSLTNVNEVELALADGTKILDGDAMALFTWQQRVSHVRDGVARFDQAMRYAETLQTGDALNLRVAQLPFQKDDRWIGLPGKEGKPLPGGKLSLIAHAPGTLDIKQSVAGVFIDEWVEVIPNASETTGLVFQYDQPNACAPQVMLLVVPPDPDNQPAWTIDTLPKVLAETLDLSHSRAVGPEALAELGQFLPALYFALNTEGDTITTDFLRKN